MTLPKSPTGTNKNTAIRLVATDGRKFFNSSVFPTDIFNIRKFGAGSGDADKDTNAFLEAAAVGGRIFMPEGTYFLNWDQIVFTGDLVLFGEGPGKTILKPADETTPSKLLAFEGHNIRIQDFSMDGDSLTSTISTSGRAIFVGDGTNEYQNINIENVRIHDFTASDGLIHTNSNLDVCHCIYADKLENVSIQNCDLDQPSGAAIFLRDVEGLKISDNRIHDTGWYSVHCEGGVRNAEISNNIIDNAGRADGIYYGGGIDLMSQHSPLETRNQHIKIIGNELLGFYSYGAVIRILSSEDVHVEKNRIYSFGVGTDPSADPESITAIRVGTRGVSTIAENGPCQNIHIRNNTLEGPSGTGTLYRAIYCDNFYQSTFDPFKNLYIIGNEILSPNVSNRFSSGITVHGGTETTGGVENVHIKDNFVQCEQEASQVISGLIGITGGGANSYVTRVYIGNNFLRDLGNESSSYQTGIDINQYVQQVYSTSPNYIQDCHTALITRTNSQDLDESLARQNFSSNGTDVTLNVDLSPTNEETATGTYTLSPEGVTLINSTGGAVTGTLGNGWYIGQIKTIVMINASNSSTVSITNHQTSDPEVATFDAVDETGVFMWTGTEWITLFATCTF